MSSRHTTPQFARSGPAGRLPSGVAIRASVPASSRTAFYRQFPPDRIRQPTNGHAAGVQPQKKSCGTFGTFVGMNPRSWLSRTWPGQGLPGSSGQPRGAEPDGARNRRGFFLDRNQERGDWTEAAGLAGTAFAGTKRNVRGVLNRKPVSFFFARTFRFVRCFSARARRAQVRECRGRRRDRTEAAGLADGPDAPHSPPEARTRPFRPAQPRDLLTAFRRPCGVSAASAALSDRTSVRHFAGQDARGVRVASVPGQVPAGGASVDGGSLVQAGSKAPLPCR